MIEKLLKVNIEADLKSYHDKMRNLHLNSHCKIEVSGKSGKFHLDPNSFHFHVASTGCITIYSSGLVLILKDEEIEEISIVEALREENISNNTLAGIEVTTEGNVVLATQNGKT